MQANPELPSGTTLLAEGGIQALGEMCKVLRSAGIQAALVDPPKHCNTGCSPKAWLAVADQQVADAVRVLKEHEERDLDEIARAAAKPVDFDAPEAECPACGTRFQTSASRCPDCGLNFGG